MDALMVVAHPDDETIWAHALLSRNKGWNWTIASMCRASDADRKPKFEKACAIYNAKPFIADLEDTLLEKIDNRQVQELLQPFAGKNFDFVFTHGRNGEYGHIRHKDVHKAVCDAVREKKILCRKFFVFDYKKTGSGLVPAASATKKMVLSDSELERKKFIVETLYGYASDSLDVGYCTRTEAFREVSFE